MDKSLFRSTERKLYNYFEQEEVIKSIKCKIEKLEKQVEQITEDIKNNNVVITEESRSISYEERVQSSSDCTSYAERELIKAIERLETEKDYKLTKILDLKASMREIEESSYAIEYNIKMLSKEDYNFIELKYKRKLSIEEVADELGMARATAYRKREELIEDIANWCNIIK